MIGSMYFNNMLSKQKQQTCSSVTNFVRCNVRILVPMLFLCVTLVVVNFTINAQTTPIFWWNGTRWDYFAFINNVRRNVNAYNNEVPNGNGNTIDHTDSSSTGHFFDVVIGTQQGNQVRIRIRASDLYVTGWFTHNDVYNFIGSAWEAGIPADHSEYNNGGTGGNWQLSNSGNYIDLEHMASSNGNFDRANVHYDQLRVDAFAMDLWKADDHARMAAAVVYFAQFISEAARFRGVADVIGWNGFADRSEDNWQFSTTVDRNLVGQEQNWDSLSQRFNWMLENNINTDTSSNVLNLRA